MNEKELGCLLGRFDTFENTICNRFDEQGKKTEKIFKWLERHDMEITKLKQKASTFEKCLGAIPILLLVILTAYGLWQKFG